MQATDSERRSLNAHREALNLRDVLPGIEGSRLVLRQFREPA